MIQFLPLASLLVIAAFWNHLLSCDIMNYPFPTFSICVSLSHGLGALINVIHITFSSPFLSLSFFSEQGLDSVTRLQFSVWRHVFQNLASSPDIHQQEIETKGRT